MKTIFLVWLGVLVVTIYSMVQARYTWSSNFGSYWDLADKSSTIAQKSEYIDIFVQRLEASNLQGTNDALFFTTPNNSFDYNLDALKTLQSRLNSIKDMDENSFAYQTAIQQITAQEQGQAEDMLNVLQNCWLKVNYYWLWNPFMAVFLMFFLIGFPFVGLAFLAEDDYYY